MTVGSDQFQDWRFPLDTNLGLREYSVLLPPLSSNRAPPEHMYQIPRQKEESETQTQIQELESLCATPSYEGYKLL